MRKERRLWSNSNCFCSCKLFYIIKVVFTSYLGEIMKISRK